MVHFDKLRLSGFKSFVDPTTVKLPSNLCGIVGPNGCGKSNIIDAVRWVLGESKASELRGESMQDVIFNGTNTRKPAGRASVELVFDNSLGRAACFLNLVLPKSDLFGSPLNIDRNAVVWAAVFYHILLDQVAMTTETGTTFRSEWKR